MRAVIRGAFCAATAIAVGLALASGEARAVGEAVNGFPNWAERVIHEWINRARVDPQLEMTACGSPCVERACYGVMPPLPWSEALNRAARFHSDEMVRQGYFAHNSACTVVSGINSLYPGSCDGSAACACVGGARACSPTCTGFAQRVQLFGGAPSGEIIASPSNPHQAFYLWLYEPGDTSSCTFTSANGHRWLILKSTGAVGTGVAGYSTGDFGSGSAPARIPSGAHYPQQAAAVSAWANWYDTAGPSAAAINVDGVCTPMTLQRGTQTNGAWSATLSGVGSGCHRYYFTFRDAAGTAVTYPTTGSLAIGSGAGCPDWDGSRPAACADGSASPTPTPTPLPSLTPTPTVSASATATSTATASASPTATRALSAESVSGSVRYRGSGLAVPGISLDAGGGVSATSDSAGHYRLANVPLGAVVVAAAGSGGAGSAVSALDASWVLQAVAGMRTLSPEQVLAGDVTGNGSLSSLDASLILQRTVGLLDRFPVATACASDWAFLPVPAPVAGQTLIAPQPSAVPCRAGGIAYQSVVGSPDGQDFAALAFGDCTGNWRPPNAAVARRAATTTTRSGRLRPLRGGRLALPIALDGARPAHAIAVRVTYDPAALRVVHTRRAAAGALLAANTREPGALRLALASAAGFAAGGSPVAVVVFERRGAPGVAAPLVSMSFDSE